MLCLRTLKCLIPELLHISEFGCIFDSSVEFCFISFTESVSDDKSGKPSTLRKSHTFIRAVPSPTGSPS